jgi:phosphoserine phosphatase RsbU/P
MDTKPTPRPSRPSRPRRVAVLTEFLTDNFEPVLDEVIETAGQHGIEVLSFSQGVYEWPPSRNLVTDLPGPACVDGVLVVSLGNVLSVRALVDYCERYRPLPICSMTVPWTEHPSVLVDNEPGMRGAIRHLIRVHARRRIAFVRGPDASAEARLRFRVYGEVLAEHGIEIDARLVSAPGWAAQTSGSEHVRRLVEDAVAFDAVACVNDGAAFGVLRELAACGIRVPDEVAVVGFDDVDVSRSLESPLTTVRQPIRAQAREAFAVLLSQMAGEPRPATVPLRTELVIRESCGCSPYALEDRAGGADSRPASVDDLRRAGAGATESAGAIAVAAAAGTLGAHLARELYEALLADLSSGGTSFSDALDRALRGGALVRGESATLQEWITVLGRTVADRLDEESVAWRRADAALHGARVRISNAGERMPAKEQLRIEGLCQRLSSLTRAFAGVQSIASIVAVFAERLPALGVSSCYVCLYEEGEGVPAEWARLVLAWDAHRGPLAVPPEGLRFRCRELLPGSVFAGDRALAYVTSPLEYEIASPGYVVWGKQPSGGRGGDGKDGGREPRAWQEGFVYESLQVQIAAVFRELHLRERLVDETRRRESAERAHLEKDVHVARRIRTDLVPRDVRVAGLAIAVRCVSSSELGGGLYHDVVPVEGGCWIGVGGVTGRGLPTGLVVLMLQSVVSGLARSSPAAAPSDLAELVQTVLLENTWRRADHPERATLTLLRYRMDGSVALSGEHARLLIGRAGTGRVEAPGAPDGDAAYQLAPGDVFVLYGWTAGEGPGQVRRDPDLDAGHLAAVLATLARMRHQSVDAIGEALVAEVRGRTMRAPAHARDLTLIVGRHMGPGPDGEPAS